MMLNKVVYIEWRHFQWPWMTLAYPRFQGHAIIRRLITLMSLKPFFMLLLKTKRPSTLTGRNVRLSKPLISSCFQHTIGLENDYLAAAVVRLFGVYLNFVQSTVLKTTAAFDFDLPLTFYLRFAHHWLLLLTMMKVIVVLVMVVLSDEVMMSSDHVSRKMSLKMQPTDRPIGETL